MRISICIILIIIFALINVLPANAQVIQIVTLEQAIDQATRTNPSLTATRAKLGVSEAQLLSARARLNPALVTDNGVAEKSYRLGISQVIELGGKRKKRIALAQAKKNVITDEINTALLDLRQKVRNSYIELYSAQEKMKAANEVLTATEKLAEIAKKRQLAGDIAVLDVMQTDITKLNARNDLLIAKLQMSEALNNLNACLGKPINEGVQLAPPGLVSKTGEIDSLIEEAYNNRPELKAIINNMEVANRQIDVAKANRVPNLIYAVGPDIVLPGGEENGGTHVNVFVTASIELPVMNRQKGAIEEALAERNQAEKDLAAEKCLITQDIRNAYMRMTSYSETIKTYENDLLPTAQKVADMSRRSFEEGKSGILTPIIAQQAYVNTRFAYVQVLTNYQNAVSDLERAIGAGL